MSVMIDAYKIEKHMRDNRIGQSELAQRMGVDRKTLSTYLKTGEVKKPKFLEPMASALGVQVEWLLLPKGSIVGNTQKGNDNAIGSTVYRTSSTDADEVNRLRKQVEDLNNEKMKLLNIIEKLTERN